MTIDPGDFRVREGDEVHLDRWPTRVEPAHRSKKTYRRLLEDQVAECSDLQRLLNASNRHASLPVFQAMDAAGEDGAIEQAHDVLWRTRQCLPERGRVGLFKRCCDEEVPIVRVHPEIRPGQGLPDGESDRGDVWRGRHRSIVEHEKNRKFSPADIEQRGFRAQCMHACEACLGATSPRTAPWFVVPADDKDNARLIIAGIVVDTSKSLHMRVPRGGAQRRRELAAPVTTLATRPAPMPRAAGGRRQWGPAQPPARPMPWYSSPMRCTSAGSQMLRPSNSTGCLSVAFRCSKSGVRNSFHSVTSSSASAPCSASAALSTKATPRVPSITRRASAIATGS